MRTNVRIIQSAAERDPAKFEDEESRLLIRYQTANARSGEVISLVTSRSFCSPRAADPSETVASLEVDDLVVRLTKSKDSAFTSSSCAWHSIP